MPVQWGQQLGAKRLPALPSVVYVRIHNFRGKQLSRERWVVVNGGTIHLLCRPCHPHGRTRRNGSCSRHSRRAEWARCFRSQLPTKLAFGVTHHKGQVATLDRVVLDIGKREINDGQSFTALSTCRDINNILLEDFSQTRLQAIGKSASSPARLAALDRIRSFGDQMRQTFDLTALRTEPRASRPVTTSNI